LWLHSLKVAQLLRSAACLHTNQSRSYLNHLVVSIYSLCLLLETKFINNPTGLIYIQTKMFRKCILFPFSDGVDIKIFLLWWTSGWKYCDLTVSIFSPWEQQYMKPQLMKELFLSPPPEDGNTNRIRKFVAFVKRNKEKAELQMHDTTLSAETKYSLYLT